jgi:endonuclease-3
VNRQERAHIVKEILDLFIPEPEIPLTHRDPYTLLIAVLLSAQCTDARVNQVTPHLFARASTPQQMIDLSIPEIQALIRPCGLSSTKAKAIWNLSKIIIEHHHGNVPASFEALEELPGVGHKTASVVMAQGFHQPAFPVDTHIHRCAKRWKLSRGKNVIETEKDLKALYPPAQWNRLHLQIILFARTYCPALRHQIDQCPICSLLERPKD